jgi:type IV pilus assembly protein PilM
MLGFGRKKRGRDRKLIIDLGTQYVKIIDLHVKKNQAKLHNYRILNLVTGGRRFIGKEISKILKKSVLDMKISGNTVLTSISGKAVVVRFMDVPTMTLKELKSSLKYQSELRVPFDLNDAMYDCQILPGAPVPEGKMRVLVAASPRREASKTLDVIRGAGLMPFKVDVDVIALANAFEWGKPEGEDTTYALVNIGAARTNLSVIHNGLPALCRELNYGGISFTEAVSNQFGLGFDEAEEKKIRGDAQVLGIVEEAMKPVIQGLSQSFDFFEGSSGAHVSKVYLSGGGAQIRGVMDVLKSSLNRTVLIWNPLRNINIDSIEDKELLQSNSPLLTIAMGIGLGEGDGS